jgi:ribosome recycling factor
MRLRDIANITIPEPSQLLVSPFDANNAGAISKAIEAANLGVRPTVDGNAVRITVPSMDESTRKEMVKLCGRRCEEAKVSIRNARRDGNEGARAQQKDGDIGEDQLKRFEKEIQSLTDDYCKQADELSKAKENEVMEI